MESHHELPVGRELRAASETGQIPAVPAGSDASGQSANWRTSVGIALALVLAFVVITLVSL
ncbi:hypothetical protein CFK41_16805 [Brachybacterium ginsengisoli]|uniref:Uncharacterized protein n=1 Tax=Brachybacterium ginsengisoli TaxID=1331682 RepID=A0A291H1A4_9MICO|nr:hypothetical protein [Brachybacterium ginsengisoli]ATG56251.1 hypothetical protein CFK41_16805 [Brachybacterium ginsengisoli]